MSYGEPDELLDRDGIIELFIDLEESGITPDDPRCYHEAGMRLKKVRHLDLADMREEDITKALQLFDIFETTVREIDLRKCEGVGAFGYHNLARRVLFCRQLRVLSLDVEMLPFLIRFKWLLACFKLKKVVIDIPRSYNGLYKLQEARDISQFIRSLGSVGHLEFGRNYLVHPSLFPQLGTISSLKVLSTISQTVQ